MPRSLAIALVALGCGGGAGTTNDAAGGPADGASLDGELDAPWTVGTIKVTARNGEISPLVNGAHPSANTAVVFADATQYTQVVMTDADGIASATVTGPTTVTHVQTWNSLVDEAMAVIGAMPGDDILLERINRDSTVTAPIQISFTPAASTSYWACSACACQYGTTSPISVPMAEFCRSDPAPIVLLAGGASAGYATASVAYNSTTGGAATLAPTQPLASYAGSFTNLPVLHAMRLAFVAGLSDSKDVQGPSPAEVAQVRGWDGLPKRLEATLVRSDTALQVVNEPVAASTTGFALDGDEILPWLGQPFFDVPSTTLHAPSLPGAREADLFISTFMYPTTSARTVAWTLIAAAPGTFKLPSIPASVLDVTPATDPSPGIGTSLVFETGSVDGFADARRDPLRLWRESWYGGTERIRRSESPHALPHYLP